jgi:predicted nucleotidyltransferase
MASNSNKTRSTEKKTAILERKLETEKDIAMDFATRVQKKFDRIVKASVLFGSQTTGKHNATAESDIDIILIVDDASIEWDQELVAWYREELAKLIADQDYGKELHINTVRLTTWWQDMLHGDPVVINILRYGEALIDYGGFFNPQKALLLQGKIRSTPEAVYAALQRAPWHIARSRASQMGAIEGVIGRLSMRHMQL